MSHDHSAVTQATKPEQFKSSGRWIIWAASVVILAFYLFTAHRPHLYGALPFLILLLCPLMHIFGHKHHGGYNAKPKFPQSQATK